MAGATATNQYFMAPNMSDVSANPKDWWKSFALGMGTQVNPETGATENIMAPGGPGMSSALGVNGTLIDLFLNRKDRKEQEKKAEEAQLGIDKFHASEKKGLYDPKFNQSLADAYSFGVRSTDTSGIQSAAQTAMNAASADPRVAAGMINQVQGNLGNQMLAANQSDMMRQQQQMLGYGQKKQALGEQATAFDKELGLTKLGEDKQAYNTAQQNLEALKQQKRQTFANMANNASDLAMTAIGMPPLPKMGNNDASTLNPLSIMGSNLSKYAKGGMLPYAKGGMTPGEFSHERNPIHMMDDMGNKVGEATGGEMILNPDQSDAIEDAFESMGSNPSKDDLMYLYEVIRGIFSQPQFKD
jgi:hypothetical protein